MTAAHPTVSLRAYCEDDLELLRGLLGDEEMMRFLGGAESEDALVARHARYLAADPLTNGLVAIEIEGVAAPVGWVGFWEAEWDDHRVWECGWHVSAAYQHAGVATAAGRLMLDEARARGRNRFIDAFPAVDNVGSNRLCERLGFERLGEAEVEYPKGRPMRSVHWRLDLGESR